MVVLATILLTIQTVKSRREARLQSEQMWSQYVENHRQIVRLEVERVVKVIDYETDKHFQEAQEKVRARVIEAYAIAENIYEQNKNVKTEAELKKIIIDAIRPIRYDQGRGYYFINGYDGVPKMVADTPELEGQNLLDTHNSRGQYVVRDLINIVKSKGEGFYTYFWTKPGNEGDNFQKVSFVKLFKPFEWFIGTGVYLDAVEETMQKIILHYVATHRFGPNKEGYVFINELLNINGGPRFARVYANPNRPNDTGMPISDDFKDAKGKMFRKEFLQGLRANGECFVDYWYRKLDNPEPSPKTSFFKLAGNGRFIVAAGVYVDDIEEQIALILARMDKELRRSLLVISLSFLAVILSFIFFINFLSKKLANDFQLFEQFFREAADSSEAIMREHVRFEELDQLALHANRMLRNTIDTEQALKNERERLLVTLHSIVDGVIATDTRGMILLMNKVAEDLTGWGQNEALGHDLDDVFMLEGPRTGESETMHNHELEPTGGRDVRGTLKGRNGGSSQVVTSRAPIVSEDEVVQGYLIVFRDETEKLKTEEELFKVRKLESVGLLAGGLAHDFNNILAGLFGNIELARLKLEKGHEAAGHLDMAHEAMERATHLTNQLLTFAKGGEPVLRSYSLGKNLDDLVSFHLSGSPVKPVYAIADNLWDIQADPGQIGQVIGNLVMNAKHAMPTGGRLYVSAENVPVENSVLQRDCVELRFIDEGIGMGAEVLEKIFDPYFSTKQTGSGLGLATVYSIIEKHNGKISVSSEVNKGSAFTILLPAEKYRESDQVTWEKDAEFSPVDGSLRILVVDDDESVRKVLVQMLSRNGYRVSEALEGDEGIRKYQAALEADDRYTLVFLDLTIPGGKGGKETIQEILQLDPDVRSIAISGYSTDPIMANYSRYGFSGRLAKPFNMKDVREELARVLQS